MSAKDRLFLKPGDGVSDFVFDERVVRVFPDMINRSVPGYGLLVPMIALMARRHAQAGSRLYDLGCSLGAVALAMSRSVEAKGAEIVAVDNSPAMIERLQQLLPGRQGDSKVPVRVICGDIRDTEVVDASVVVLNFTLQFVAVDERMALLRRIAAGMRPGAVLLLSEKICFDTAPEQAHQTAWHHDFKKAQGYSELEIARKREALENVMQPESLACHRQRLADAGFSAVHQWFQAFSFVSLAAFK